MEIIFLFTQLDLICIIAFHDHIRKQAQELSFGVVCGDITVLENGMYTTERHTDILKNTHAATLDKFLKKSAHSIPETTMQKLVYIDLLQRIFPVLGIDIRSALPSPMHPISPYFLEGSRAQVRHKPLLKRLVQKDGTAGVTLNPPIDFQPVHCFEKIFQLAHSIAYSSQSNWPETIKQLAIDLINETVSTVKEPIDITECYLLLDRATEFAKRCYQYYCEM